MSDFTAFPRPASKRQAPVRAIAAVVAITVIAAAGLYGGARYLSSQRAAKETAAQVALVRSLLDRNEAAPALDVLAGLEAQGYELGEEGDWLAIRAHRAAGNSTRAGELAEAFQREHPRSERLADVELVALKADLAAGAPSPETLGRAQAILASNPGAKESASIEAALGIADAQGGNLASARARFNQLWAQAPDDPKVRELAAAISEANRRALREGTVEGGFTEHKIAKGEAIYNIAKKYGITPEALMEVNGVTDPRRLRIGQALRVPTFDFSLVCDVGANALKLMNKGELFLFYDVRTGRDAGATPQGTFKVLNKKQNPTWRPGNGHVYQPGDPNNELGTRWMAFEGDILGIHGTIREETVGAYASNGCIGMRKSDVEELFDLINVGTPITIVGEQDPTRHAIIPPPTIPPPQQIAMR
ncbi:MAG: L,D-transpeptidase family protein [Candidatus Sumerlaeia bacterium]|nr:L,D-transpeptidase family protein [Candidatus Sumerlaeia bacterium]